MHAQKFKQRVMAEVDAIQDKLWEISKTLYENPEIAFKEYKSSTLLSETLAEAGFTVERAVGNIETAFRAGIKGKDAGPSVAFLAEYDALPVIGHACGHNLIASAAVGAGLAMLAVLPELGGGVLVIGTPAEEGGGGKIIMKQAGVFDGLDAVMMVHPASKDMVMRGSLASTRLKVEFHGKPAHAAAKPHLGINALDALLLTFNNINALRQHLHMTDRVAGIITNGGVAANIVPAYTSAEFSVRGRTTARRAQVLERVIACAQAGAQATGCRLEYQASGGYDHIIPNQVLADLFASNLQQLGRQVVAPLADEPMGSTDMGNVSHVAPSLHPYLAVVPDDIPGHSIEFREACISPVGRAALLDGAKAMAMTAVDLLTNPEFVENAWSEHKTALAAQ